MTGWTRESIRQYLRQQACIPFGEWKRRFRGATEAKHHVPGDILRSKDDSEPVPMPFVESMPIIVAGGPGEKSMLMPCWANGRPVSVEVHLPVDWK